MISSGGVTSSAGDAADQNVTSSSAVSGTDEQQLNEERLMDLLHFETNPSIAGMLLPGGVTAEGDAMTATMMTSTKFDDKAGALRALRQSEENGISWSGGGFSVVLPYAAPFAALRSLYCEGDEQAFLDSLRRSIRFEPKGGKSNSKFFTTLDGRFIIKQVSKAEFYSLHTLWPRYFEFMAEHYEATGVPQPNNNFNPAQPPSTRSAFCKIFALFQVDTGFFSPVRSYILMEKLFDMSNVTRVYDLKGLESMKEMMEGQSSSSSPSGSGSGDNSAKNSNDNKNKSSGNKNMMNPSSNNLSSGAIPSSSPIATNSESNMSNTYNVVNGKSTHFEVDDGTGKNNNNQQQQGAEDPESTRRDAELMEEIDNGYFYFCRTDVYRNTIDMLEANISVLDKACVMDYSLIVAIDDSTRTMQIGIVDYMRLFSRDKEIEQKLKEWLFNRSTVKNPPKYASRFIHAMKHYFCAMPTRETRIVTAAQQQRGKDQQQREKQQQQQMSMNANIGPSYSPVPSTLHSTPFGAVPSISLS